MKNDKIIKNLEVRSIALTLATIAGLSLVGCTEKVEAEDMTPTRAATIEVMETPKTTPLPTIEATIEPTPAPYLLTAEDVEKMAKKIWNDNPDFFENTSLDGFKEPYNIYDVENLVCYANGYDAINPESIVLSTGGNPGVYYPYALYHFCTGSGNYRALARMADAQDIEKYGFKYSDWYKEGTYEQEMFSELEEEFAYAISEEGTEDDIERYWGKVIKILLNREIDGHIIFDEMQPNSVGLLIDMFYCQGNYCMQVINDGNEEVLVKASYIYEELEGTELGDRKIKIDRAFNREPYEKAREDEKEIYAEISSLAYNEYNEWEEYLDNEWFINKKYERKLSK